MAVGPRKILSFIGVITGAALMLVSYLLGGATGMIILVGIFQISTTIAVFYTYATLRRQLELRTHAVTRVSRELGQQNLDLEHNLASMNGELKRELRLQRRNLNRRLVNERKLTDQGLLEVQQRLTSVARTISEEQYHQIEALFALYQDIQPKAAFPPLRDWAVSPDLLHFLYRRIIKDGPGRILEMGSGVSTLVMAYALQRLGQGQIVSLDHSEHFRDETAAQLEQHGLAHWVDIRLAPLESIEVDGETYLWYSTDELPGEAIDMVFVDGPPGKTNANARYPALPVTQSLLTKEAVVILDDYARNDEKVIASRWIERFPDFILREVSHEKGTAVLESGI